MRLKICLALALTTLNIKASDQISRDLLEDGKTVQDIMGMVADLGLNCASIDQWAIVVREFNNLAKGIARVIVEEAQTLAYKPDYPTVCHVLTNAQIATYEEHSVKKSWGGGPRWGNSQPYSTQTTQEQKRPTYYWPKYFIEVTEKGNDAHPSFAKNNVFYGINRKISNSLGSYIDIDGPLKLMSGLFLKDNLLGTLGVKTQGDTDMGALMKTAVLSPFEKARLVANHEKTHATYEANIWPVGLSQTIAEHLTVCGPVRVKNRQEPGGYGWNLKGVPMTCPVAMTKDAYAYWDTGVIDYIDPQAVAAMATAANPAACGAAAAADALGGMRAGNSEAKGESSQVGAALSKLTEKLRGGLKTCSWPIIGSSEAIAKKAVAATDAAKWLGPYCTVWGALAPRSSSSPYQNDYSYANSALKFKLLAHELFGVPRGNRERWSLAYPWEGPGASNLSESLKKQFPFLASMNISALTDKVSAGSSSGLSRAEDLYQAGDPRLVDTSLNGNLISTRVLNLAKEIAYLAALEVTSNKVADKAKDAYLKHSGKKLKSSEEILGAEGQHLDAIEEQSAELGKQPIYGTVTYCHRSEQDRGLLFGDLNRSFDVGIALSSNDLPYRGPTFPFSQYNNKKACLTHSGFSGCQNWKGGLNHYCADVNDGLAVYYHRQEIVGWQEAPNPVFKTFAARCGYLGKYRDRKNKVVYRYECHDSEISQTSEDTRKRVSRPDPKNHRSLAENNEQTAQAIGLAAKASTWVAAEIARNKYADMTGHNYLPGEKRVYTIWEKIDCVSPSKVTTVSSSLGSYTRYESCEEAIRYIVYKYFQTKLLRRFCDGLGKKQGDPWK